MEDKSGNDKEHHKSSGAAGLGARKLFLTEVTWRIARFRDVLMQASGQAFDREAVTELAELVRALRCGARLAKVGDALILLDALSHWLETLAEHWHQDVNDSKWQATFKKRVPALLKSCDCLQGMASDAASGEPMRLELTQEASELSASLGKMPEFVTDVSLPEAPALTLDTGDNTATRAEQIGSTPEKDVSPAILKMRDFFWKELEERVEVLTRHLLELEQGLSSPQRLETMMRMAHTIKGGARLAEIDPVMQLAHTLEDIFVSAQKSQITIDGNHTDLLLKGVDTIVRVSEQATQHSGIDRATMEQYESLRQALGNILADPDNFGDKAADVLEPEEVEAAGAGPESNEAEVLANTDDVPGERVIRVNAEKLNKVIGLAGELSVESRQLKKFWQEHIKLRRSARSMSQVVEKCVALMKSYQVDENDRHCFNELLCASMGIESAVSHNCEVLEEYERKTTGLTDKLMRETLAHRMRPFKEGTQGLLRLARTVSRKLGKKVRLTIRGEDTRVDRDILEQLNVPLTHLIQNAIDHGFEPADVRRERGKPEEGQLIVEARHKAGLLVITVKDDGSGVDRKKLQASIVEKNMAAGNIVVNMTDTELYDFLLLPNFTLKEQVSTVSGRGVGLDIVHQMIQDLRGRMVIRSEEGEGCLFEMLLPLTLSILRCVVVEVSGFFYALPVGPLNKVLTFTPDAIHLLENQQYILDSNGMQLGLVNSHQLLGLPEKRHVLDWQEAIVLGRGTHQYAMTVDAVIGETTLVERPLDPRMGKVDGISSAACLDDGTPILILDADDLVLAIERLITRGQVDKCDSSVAVNEPVAGTKRVLVVDDSMTVRELERSLLEDRGYQVDVAVDGVDGWNAVRMNEYDLVISDVDMPRMDGIEFISHIRSEHPLQNLPVIIVSYKDRESDRTRGLEVGADHYLTKGSFMDETFISTVRDLIGAPLADGAGGSGDIPEP